MLGPSKCCLRVLALPLAPMMILDMTSDYGAMLGLTWDNMVIHMLDDSEGKLRG